LNDLEGSFVCYSDYSVWRDVILIQHTDLENSSCRQEQWISEFERLS